MGSHKVEGGGEKLGSLWKGRFWDSSPVVMGVDRAPETLGHCNNSPAGYEVTKAGGCWQARKSAQERSMGHNAMCLSPGLSHVEGAWLPLNSGAHGIQTLSQKTPEPRVPLSKKVPSGSVVTAI